MAAPTASPRFANLPARPANPTSPSGWHKPSPVIRRSPKHGGTVIATLDYGYDFRRMQIDSKPAERLAGDKASIEVTADRGWQSSGLRLQPGKYRSRRSGRYQIGTVPRVWFCEPGGVTIRYYRGRPLGILLAAVRTDEADAGPNDGLFKPLAVGQGTTLELERPATLYFRINDRAGQSCRQRRHARRNDRRD